MQSLVHILFSNAVCALVLAMLIWPIGLVLHKPAIIRALWIIVLLKLISPPILSVPLDRLVRHAQRPAAVDVVPTQQQQIILPEFVPPQLTTSLAAPKSRSVDPIELLLLIWASGSGILLAVGAARIVVLWGILRKARYAPGIVQNQSADIAARFGIFKLPGVWFVPGVVCPALWAFGRQPRIIIPYNLWCRLDDAQRQTLLAHELAHLRRGDHWVRLLEFIATVAYWWHPAVWFARRQIHDCEEQCCDAWVLWAMPASARSYGSALLEAVDFVSTYRPMRPALAAGLGEFRHLKRRLLMIKQGTVSRALSRTSLVAICGAAAFALPLNPSIGQEAAAPPGALPPGASPSGAAPAGALPPGEQSPNSASSESGEIAQARKRVEELQRELGRAMSRLAVLEHGASGGSAAGGGMSFYGSRSGSISNGSATPSGDSITLYRGLPDAPGQPGYQGAASGTIGIAPAMPPGAQQNNRGWVSRQPSAGTVSAGGPSSAGAGGGISFGSSALPPASNDAPRANGSGRPGGGMGSSSNGESDPRLDSLEKELHELMNQVRELKDMQQKEQNRGNEPEKPPSA